MPKQKPAPFCVESEIFLRKEKALCRYRTITGRFQPQSIGSLPYRSERDSVEIDALQAGGKGIGITAEAVGKAGFLVSSTAFLRCHGGATAKDCAKGDKQQDLPDLHTETLKRLQFQSVYQMRCNTSTKASAKFFKSAVVSSGISMRIVLP